MSYIIIGLVTFCFVIYMNKKEGKEYNPLFYAICSALFGLLFGMFMYFARYYKDKEEGKNTTSTVFYVLAAIMACINVVVLIASI